MITSSKSYPFGGKVSTVASPTFDCLISTAKAGLFSKQSTKFLWIGEGFHKGSEIAELQYNDCLSKEERLQVHDSITKYLDACGNKNQSLRSALDAMFKLLLEKGTGTGALSLMGNITLDSP